MKDMCSEWWFNRRVTIVLCMVLGIHLNAQNLIRNGSFEDTLSCPNAPNQLNKAIGWFSPTYDGTPDFFHSCSNQMSVYSSFIGSEPPLSGNAFAGFGISKEGPNSNYQEYICSKLKQPLNDDEPYVLSFYLSLADLSPYRTDSISVHFSADTLPNQISNYNDSTPTLTLFIREMTYYGWINITAIFNGSSDYRYVTIGYFKKYLDINLIVANNVSPYFSEGGVYYFIEDIEICPINFHSDLKNSRICMNEPLLLEAPYYEDMSYAWYYDGVQISDSCCPVIDNPSAGWYYLEYTDFRGDTYQDSMYVSLKNCAEESIIDEPGVFQEQEHFLFLPTWFAPTQSQYWHPQWQDLEYWEVTVYNSLGQVVHRYTGSPELHPGWDGFSMATGVYCAVVNARAYNGEQLRAVEKVMVLR